MREWRLSIRTRSSNALLGGLLAHLPHLVLLTILILAELTLLGEDSKTLTRDIGTLAESWWYLTPYVCAAALFVAVARWENMLWRREAARDPVAWLRERPWLAILTVRIPLAIALTFATSFLYFTFKVNIPVFTDFTADPFLIALDRAIFFGRDAWQVTHAILPWPTATRVLDALYLIWYLVLFASIAAIGAAPLRNPLRLTFLLALGLEWAIGGIVIAILLPAAGPVYLDQITGDPTFAPLMERLDRHSESGRLFSLEIQDWLWQGYATPAVEPAGISAFPSLHVAVPLTCALLALGIDFVVGWLLMAFTLSVLVGSVHLGWHYAVDGIGGLMLGFASWWSSARLVHWWLRRLAFVTHLGRSGKEEFPLRRSPR